MGLGADVATGADGRGDGMFVALGGELVEIGGGVSV